jgi:four helix bundle protein
VLAVLAMLDVRALKRAHICAWLRAAARGGRSLRSRPAWTAPARGGEGGAKPARGARARCKEFVLMLRIYPVLLDLVRSLKPVLKQLERCDSDLARQFKKALSSAPLNVAEGSYNRGKNRPARYHTALGSLREVLACCEVAEALGYIPEIDPEIRRRFDHVLGTLVKLVGGH